jgi:hypothetical protein
MASITLDDAMIPNQRTNQAPNGIFGRDSPEAARIIGHTFVLDRGLMAYSRIF